MCFARLFNITRPCDNDLACLRRRQAVKFPCVPPSDFNAGFDGTNHDCRRQEHRRYEIKVRNIIAVKKRQFVSSGNNVDSRET